MKAVTIYTTDKKESMEVPSPVSAFGWAVTPSWGTVDFRNGDRKTWMLTHIASGCSCTVKVLWGGLFQAPVNVTKTQAVKRFRLVADRGLLPDGSGLDQKGAERVLKEALPALEEYTRNPQEPSVPFMSHKAEV
jgi:hypothetical protein